METKTQQKTHGMGLNQYLGGGIIDEKAYI